MIETEISLTSLCYISEDYDGRIWLYRLADVENGLLHTPFKSNRPDNYFENRDRLYRNDGPSVVGTVGVWRWTAIPNRDNPAIDYVQSYFAKELSPIRIVVLPAKTIDEITNVLRNGNFRVEPYFCDTLFCYEENDRLTGILCRSNELVFSEKRLSLSERLYSVPIYSISVDVCFSIGDKNLCFLKSFQLDDPIGFASVGNSDDVIKSILLERSTRKLIKECFGVSNAQWRGIKDLLERICDSSLYEELASRLNCTPERAKNDIDNYISRANTLIEAGDIDADVLANIALNHEHLRKICEEVVRKDWQDTHAKQIAEAKKALDELFQAKLSAEQDIALILSDTTAAQERLKLIREEIAHNEALGRETVEAVRRKIASAQEDMASFIADISAFLPVGALPQGKSSHEWYYEHAECNDTVDEDCELADNWKNEYDALFQNLSAVLCIEPELCAILTAFLYSTYINKTPIIIAGPFGEEIADIMSISLFGISAGRLHLGSGSKHEWENEIRNSAEQIIIIQNMFGSGWEDHLPQTDMKSQKQIIWVHPFVEDLQIEPRGLYNYMLPLFSENYIGGYCNCQITPGKRTDDFSPFTSPRTKPFSVKEIKKVGLSKLTLNRLERILSDAKAILDTPTRDIDIDILFGLLPFSVLTGKASVLKDVIETKQNISGFVKAEAERYFCEE